MGGFNSGRRGGLATVEGCASLVLDVCRVVRPVTTELRRQRQGPITERQLVEAGAKRWTWTRHDEQTPWAAVEVRLSLRWDRGLARLIFDVAHHHRPTGRQDQTVLMEATPCRFGGVRWWWICPATGRRCAKLYLPNGGLRFLSRGRGAYQLAYASQRADDMQRSHGRLARLHRRLGGHYRFCDDPPPPRPKWMRHATYGRLWTMWEELVERQDAIFLSGVERLLAKVT
ncbi:hypothetical protein [Falsiroseomonas sp. E2-1-a20]|uniref:hypothetical protein n=1 Tax=Falsiroseomonas sp. E2-1-a20 TaxID=3239300 RepID=UPI003F3307DB